MPSFSFENSPPGPSTGRRVEAGDRYGPAGFAAAVVTILLLEPFTLLLAVAYGGALLPFVLPPALIVVALIGYGLTRAHGTAARIGRGMRVGCLAPLVSVLIFIPAFVIAQRF